MTPGLSPRQRQHVVRTIRGELELYGGLPSLYKRHLARVTLRMAELYGVEPKVIRGIWSDHLARRRAEVFAWQREAFLRRVAEGRCGTAGTMTLSQLSQRYGADR